jgi:hypothetical protein
MQTPRTIASFISAPNWLEFFFDHRLQLRGRKLVDVEGRLYLLRFLFSQPTLATRLALDRAVKVV